MLLLTLTATTVKLNGNSYLLWAQSFRVFVGTQREVVHLLDGLPNTKDPSILIGM